MCNEEDKSAPWTEAEETEKVNVDENKGKEKKKRTVMLWIKIKCQFCMTKLCSCILGQACDMFIHLY